MADQEDKEKSRGERSSVTVELNDNSQESPKEIKPLSPLIHTLCVITIWIFCIGNFAWIYFYSHMFPIWLTLGYFLEKKCREKYGVYFLSYRFSQWITASYFWEILIRRCNTGNSVAALLLQFAGGFFALAFIFLFIISTWPIIDLNEMRVVSGTLVHWKRATGSRNCGDIITLQYKDGQIEKFRELANSIYFQQLLNKEITIWVLDEYDIVPECREFETVKQLQYKGRTIGPPYNIARHKKVRRWLRSGSIISFLTGILFLLIIWSINSRENSPLIENKES